MAREGGIGIIHKNLDVAEQALEVTKVKKAEIGMVVDPVTVLPSRRWPRRSSSCGATRSPACR